MAYHALVSEISLHSPVAELVCDLVADLLARASEPARELVP